MGVLPPSMGVAPPTSGVCEPAPCANVLGAGVESHRDLFRPSVAAVPEDIMGVAPYCVVCPDATTGVSSHF